MTPKEKAKELVHRYDTMQSVIEGFSLQDAKQCALICVDEMLEVLCIYEDISKDYQYWQEVKKEIELL